MYASALLADLPAGCCISIKFTSGPAVIVKPSSGLTRQVVQELVRIAVVAIE